MTGTRGPHEGSAKADPSVRRASEGPGLPTEGVIPASAERQNTQSPEAQIHSRARAAARVTTAISAMAPSTTQKSAGCANSPTLKFMPMTPATSDPVAVLGQLKAMLDQGLITPEQYTAKQQEVLGRM